METRPPDFPATLQPTSPRIAELDRLGDEIAEFSAHLDAATARLLDLIREFDARGGWNTGFRSCAAWLAWRVGLAPGAARERVRVARALGTLPALAEALARGELSYAKVRALTRVATAETEARLLAVGRAGTAVHVERIVRGWRRVDRQAEAREAARQHAGRALHVYQDEDGTVVLRGRLTPEVGALLLRALDAARETLYQKRRANEAVLPVTDPVVETPTRPQQQADALALLAETALHHELDPGAPGERYQVVVHVDAAVLADPNQPGQSVLEDGPRSRGNVAAAGVRREPGGDAARRGGAESGRARFPRRCGGRCTIEIGVAAFRAAMSRSARGITCATGRRAARLRCRTWRYSVAAITARCTRRVTRSSVGLTGPSSSGGRTAAHCLTCHRWRRCLPIRWRRCRRNTPRRGSAFTHGRASPNGSGNGWTWAGRSTSCIRGRHGPSDDAQDYFRFRTGVVVYLRNAESTKLYVTPNAAQPSTLRPTHIHARFTLRFRARARGSARSSFESRDRSG